MNRKTIHPQATFCRVMFDAKTELKGQPALSAAGFIEDGGLQDIMTTQLSWKNVAKTHALLESGKMCGKVVLTVDEFSPQ
jgi:NADPH:quinone reductase-like Zn-dependent oxidoreductase